MDRRSKHLSSEERGVIFAEHSRGSSQRAIGELLTRPASTICRELARGRRDDGTCCPQAARRVYDVRRTRCRRPRKLVEGGEIHRFVHDHLVHRRWSPVGQRPELAECGPTFQSDQLPCA
ncbi:MAG: helix-turn-helix domain-containing protein [Phaeovulum sp.]|jgi:IS30 family transposase|uniref:helix-turn-helix domain-containing protein n=1 Tax=Phaeovulum sp. TaxID=2934796 RepID=UPI00272F2BD9|nr:helix-turn-helix domain-containing protein [Phaeovulum sp.]MDP2062062.1 helix-turn-helix domain-containing protein [Phaeovulum sp.]